MSSIKDYEEKLKNTINLRQLKNTSIDENDYIVSIAGFLCYEGKYSDSFELLEASGVENDSLADFLRFMCRINGACEGTSVVDKEYLSKSYYGCNLIAGRLYYYDGEENSIKRVSMIRRAAFAGDIYAMQVIASFCHDGILNRKRLSGMQDRNQERWWRELQLKTLKRINSQVMYHAFNQIEGSYDRFYPEEDIEETLIIAAALGSDQAKDYLIGFYTRDMENLEKLGRSWFWFCKKIECGEDLDIKQKELLKIVKQKLNIG